MTDQIPHGPLLASNRIHAAQGTNPSSSFVRIAAAPELPKSSQPISQAQDARQPLPDSGPGPDHGVSPGQRPHLSSANVEPDTDSLGGLNFHTQGHEFYGPMGAFSFLSRLRSKALSEAGTYSSTAPTQRRNSRNLEDMSIVNLLHSSDYPVAAESNRRASQPAATRAQVPELSAGPDRQDVPTSALTNVGDWYRALPKAPEVERECVRLYFHNLHNIHPILDTTTFLTRCEKNVWGPLLRGKVPLSTRHESRAFLALYYAVLAIGSITAGEQSSLVWQQTVDFLNAAEGFCGMKSNSSTYPPLRLARLFFEKSKSQLGDTFDSCSFESAQALFLMSVFCQNALKPHSCYMYSGMAARAAQAIGVPHRTGPGSEPAAMLWWGLYSHEIEMCASAGRESALGPPSRYMVTLPKGPISDSGKDMISCMVSLARLLNELYTDVYLPQGEEHLSAKSARSQELESELLKWRAHLPPALNLETVSITEPEQVTKQKIVLRLRK